MSCQGKYRVPIGVEYVHKASESFTISEERTGQAVTLINQIAAASKAQSIDISDLSTAVSELGKLTQNNVEDSKRASSVSNEMELQFNKSNKDVESLIKLIRGNSAYQANKYV